MCYEKWADIESGKTFCHRRIVAKWLEDNLGVKVEELGNENKNNSEQLHFLILWKTINSLFVSL